MKFFIGINLSSRFFFADGALGAGTITSRWPPVPGPLGQDTNGAGMDGKHLDVGDMSDVSDVSSFS